VLIAGHPFIDIWAAVRPSVVGISRWPDVPPGQSWKAGVLRAMGWPPDVPAAWQRILRSVTSYADLEPELLGRVEELIDFAPPPGTNSPRTSSPSRGRNTGKEWRDGSTEPCSKTDDEQTDATWPRSAARQGPG
jgi:Protein of unknown function (DUF3097)